MKKNGLKKFTTEYKSCVNHGLAIFKRSAKYTKKLKKKCL